MTPDRFMNLAFALTANLTMDEKACILEREFREWQQTKPSEKDIQEMQAIMEFNIACFALDNPEMAVAFMSLFITQSYRQLSMEEFLLCVFNAKELMNKITTI